MSDITLKDPRELITMDLPELIQKAGNIRKKHTKDELELCTILNARSGSCSEDCKFCAQSSKYNTGIETYPLVNKDKMIEAAQKAKDLGAARFGIVTSGHGTTDKDIAVIAEAISEIQETIGIKVCCSLGSLTPAQFKILREAGLERFHHNIETSRAFYPSIVSSHDFQERYETVKAIKESGMQACSGGIIGMGETWEDRIDMALTLKELEVDSVPINILVPIPGTPLEQEHPLPIEDVIRCICIFRIILQDKTIKIAAGREAVLKERQVEGFKAGANGMLIGGYLTISGNLPEEDKALIREITEEWNE